MSRVLRRSVLERIDEPTPTTHPGLWLDRYLRIADDDQDQGRATGASRPQRTHGASEEASKPADKAAVAKANHLAQLVNRPVPAGYREAVARWREGFAQPDQIRTATVQGRLIIGLGQKGPAEAGLRLDHTWGVPVLPGSALKGLASRAARELLDDAAWHRPSAERPEQGRDHATLFGTTDDEGAVIFHDAWWDPEDPDAKGELPIHLDVMTVHHPKYYQGGQDPPADWDSPTPIPFLSVTGRFLVAIEPAHRPGRPAPEEAVDRALSILKLGLRELGLGAKTNAGYGRLLLDYESEDEAAERAEAEARAQAERAEEERKAAAARAARESELAVQEGAELLKHLNPGNVGLPHMALLGRLQGAARRDFAGKAIAKLGGAKEVRKRAEAGKEWARALLAALEG